MNIGISCRPRQNIFERIHKESILVGDFRHGMDLSAILKDSIIEEIWTTDGQWKHKNVHRSRKRVKSSVKNRVKKVILETASSFYKLFHISGFNYFLPNVVSNSLQKCFPCITKLSLLQCTCMYTNILAQPR